MIAARLLQLPPVKRKLILSQFPYSDSMKHLLGLQLWHLFRYAELTEVVRKNDQLFIYLLHKFPVGNIDDDVEKLLKARYLYESDENYQKDTLNMYAKNEPAIRRNEAILNDLPGKLRTIYARYNTHWHYLQAAQNQRQINTRGMTKLQKFIKFKNWHKSNVNSWLDIQDRLINGQIGNITYT